MFEDLKQKRVNTDEIKTTDKSEESNEMDSPFDIFGNPIIRNKKKKASAAAKHDSDSL